MNADIPAAGRGRPRRRSRSRAGHFPTQALVTLASPPPSRLKFSISFHFLNSLFCLLWMRREVARIPRSKFSFAHCPEKRKIVWSGVKWQKCQKCQICKLKWSKVVRGVVRDKGPIETYSTDLDRNKQTATAARRSSTCQATSALSPALTQTPLGSFFGRSV